MKRLLFIICFALSPLILRGQEQPSLKDTTDLSEYTIAELAKMKSRYAATEMEKTISLAIEAASRKPLPLRKSPSIISVITSEEIEKSGAKDFMDVLGLIPGMEFNVDVEGIVALSFRGLWSNEGNISLQIDGQEINEIAYASLQFGNHYAISLIKKIEIIRGPGSAIYGGCAEYAVINVVTRKGSDIKGVQTDIIGGHTGDGWARRKIGLSIGDKTNDLTWSASGMLARGQRSTSDYTDVYGNRYNMAGNADLNNDHLNMALAYKGLALRFIYDNYQTTNRDGDLAAMTRAYPLGFLSCMSEARYTRSWGKKLQLIVRLNHKFAEPWSFRGTTEPADSAYGQYLLRANTYRGNASFLWDPHHWLNVNCGFETYNDRGRLADGQLFRTDSVSEVSYMNYAPYAQFLLKPAFANFVLGARYDISTAFGSAFNPRVGVTKQVGIFNFKLLYASSFRAPAIESIQYGIDKMKLRPERSNTTELEASVKIRKDMYLSLNAFDINTADAIRYFVETDTPITGYPDGYRNSNIVTGSQGFELEYKYRSPRAFLNVGYSFYTVANKNVDEENIVPGYTNVTLGTAAHKLSVWGSINLNKNIYVSGSANILGRRFGYSSTDTAGNGVLTAYKPQAVLGVYAGWNEIFKNAYAGAGISNITNEKIIYPQAYNSLHAPLPGMGREYYIRLSYRIPFK